MKPKSTDLVAWSVEINSWTMVVFATTKAKANWVAVKSYWDRFGRDGTWPRPSASRAQRWDRSVLRFSTVRVAYDPSFVDLYPTR